MLCGSDKRGRITHSLGCVLTLSFLEEGTLDGVGSNTCYGNIGQVAM